jgi:hypothetical protein
MKSYHWYGKCRLNLPEIPREIRESLFYFGHGHGNLPPPISVSTSYRSFQATSLPCHHESIYPWISHCRVSCQRPTIRGPASDVCAGLYHRGHSSFWLPADRCIYTLCPHSKNRCIASVPPPPSSNTLLPVLHRIVAPQTKIRLNWPHRQFVTLLVPL